MSARPMFARKTTVSALALVLISGLVPARAEGPAIPPAAHKVTEPMLALATHRAMYKITLLNARGSKSPTDARGRVSYEFTGSACDGFSQIFRQVTEIQPAEGATRVSDMRSATFEDADGTGFSFDVKTTVDGNPPEIVDGHANKKKNDVLAIQLSKPTSQSVDVDSDVLFPTGHLKRIIAAAKAGQHILTVKVFDGSDNGQKVFDTTTIIGRQITTASSDGSAAHVAGMDGMRRWPVTISYFEEDGKKDGEPAYTLGFELYENGVSRALKFDYGDFVLSGEMTNLEMLPAKDCKRH